MQPAQLAELASCDYLERGEDVVIAGPIGTGKTHLAIALGVEAARHRQRVPFVRAVDLVRSLIEARDERSLGRLHQRYQRVALLIVDELGFVPFDRAGGELLFNLLADRYEHRSTLVTTNLAFSEWAQVFGDEKLTTALLDRLGHHAHILITRGESLGLLSRIWPRWREALQAVQPDTVVRWRRANVELLTAGEVTMVNDKRVTETIASWQARLLQLDRRNNLLYFKPRPAVRILGRTPDDLADELLRRPAGLSFDYIEPRPNQRASVGQQPPPDIEGDWSTTAGVSASFTAAPRGYRTILSGCS